MYIVQEGCVSKEHTEYQYSNTNKTIRGSGYICVCLVQRTSHKSSISIPLFMLRIQCYLTNDHSTILQVYRYAYIFLLPLRIWYQKQPYGVREQRLFRLGTISKARLIVVFGSLVQRSLKVFTNEHCTASDIRHECLLEIYYRAEGWQ